MDISSFLEFLEIAPESELYVNCSEENAIKVMSIHKAKGLGFPVVIVPFLELEIRELGSQTRKLKTSYLVYGAENEFALLRLDSKYIRFSKKLREIYRQEYKKSFIDEITVAVAIPTKPKP